MGERPLFNLRPVAFFLGICVAQAALAQDRIQGLEKLYAQVAPSIVTVRAGVQRVERTEGGVRVETGTATGAGVILHKDGFIATAAHVVELADDITVEFLDGTLAPARIATLSRSEDLALLKVDKLPASNKPASLGDSDKLAVGQSVFSVGTPLGFKHSLTAGIISAIRNQTFTPASPLIAKQVIQTDAALNQGNSGGALFNQKGEVVGIASYIASHTGGSEGLGFAVPSNLVKRRLFENALPYIGVSLRVIPKQIAELFNWPTDSALLVEHVRKGSVAQRAGMTGGFIEASVGGTKVMLGGDLIIGVGDFDASQLDQIGKYLLGLKAGDTIRYTVLRGGKRVFTEVKLEELIAIPKLGGGSAAAASAAPAKK